MRSPQRRSRCSSAGSSCFRSACSPRTSDPAEWSTRSILGWWYLVLFGSLVGYTAYVWLLQNAPISKVATYACVDPVVAIALGAIVLAIAWRIALGAAIVLASVAVLVRRIRPAEAEAAPAGAGRVSDSS